MDDIATRQGRRHLKSLLTAVRVGSLVPPLGHFGQAFLQDFRQDLVGDADGMERIQLGCGGLQQGM